MAYPKPHQNKKKQVQPQLRPGTGARQHRPLKEKRTQWDYLLLFLVLLVTLLAFVPSVNNEMIDTWDDGVYVTDNMTIRDLNAQNLKIMFTTSVNGTYVPIPLISFAIDYQLFKLNPKPYHIENLILHLICTLLVYLIFRKLKLKTLYAAFAALLFGIHPMRVESVAWITERKDLLFSIFYLSALLSYESYIRKEKGKFRYALLTLVFFILSLFSKIQAVTLPLSLLLLDYLEGRELKLRLLLEKVPHFILSLVFGIFGIFFLEKTGSLEINVTYGLIDRIFFGLHSLTIYLQKFIFPYPLSVFYPYPMSPGEKLPLIYYLSPVVLVALAVLVFLTRKKTRTVIFGSLFFLFNIMFLLQILGAGQAYMADRFTYIPYIGLFFLLAWGAQKLVDRPFSGKAAIFALMVVIPAILFSMTHSRCQDWKSSETLWSDVIGKFPGKIPTAYANRASFYRKAGEWEKAITDYDVAIRLDPKNAVSIMNRGNLYFDKGKYDTAYNDYQKAMRRKGLGNDLNKLYANLGAIYGIRKNNDSALYYLDQSIRIDSTFPNAYLNRGLIHEAMRENRKAIADYLKYLSMKPEDDRVYTSIGVNYQIMKDYRESIPWFTEGINRNPKAGIHYANRAISYQVLGEIGKAREDARKAMELGSQVPPDLLAKIGIQ